MVIVNSSQFADLSADKEELIREFLTALGNNDIADLILDPETELMVKCRSIHLLYLKLQPESLLFDKIIFLLLLRTIRGIVCTSVAHIQSLLGKEYKIGVNSFRQSIQWLAQLFGPYILGNDDATREQSMRAIFSTVLNE